MPLDGITADGQISNHASIVFSTVSCQFICSVIISIISQSTTGPVFLNCLWADASDLQLLKVV